MERVALTSQNLGQLGRGETINDLSPRKYQYRLAMNYFSRTHNPGSLLPVYPLESLAALPVVVEPFFENPQPGLW